MPDLDHDLDHADDIDVDATAADDAEPEADGPGGLRGAFGPLTGLRILVLLAAVSFTVGAVAYIVGDRQGSADPLSRTDVGFMQDMGYHHEQAVQMSLILLGKEDVAVGLKSYAQEIIVEQQFEQGFFNATLDRYGNTTDPGDTAMEWMGENAATPLDTMDGLATEEQMDQLQDATGTEAEALWIALMSEHHLGGLHMADHEARHGKDRTTRNLARAMVKTQHGEIIDIQRFRITNDLPIPEGFTDPMADQRLSPQTWVEIAKGDD